jgi:hypothetical protein
MKFFGMLVVVSSACAQKEILEGVFLPEVAHIQVEIDYQEGVLPYTRAPSGTDEAPLTIFSDNVAALFSTLPRTIEVPVALEEMTSFRLSQQTYTAEELYALSMSERNLWDTAQSRSFHVLVMNGMLERDGQVMDQTLGATLPQIRTIALFRPVIDSVILNSSDEVTVETVEQLTMVHEFGHAVGLVGAGLPAVTDHEDPVATHHCTDVQCIMHHSAAAIAGVGNRGVQFSGEGLGLFDVRCRKDIEEAELN